MSVRGPLGATTFTSAPCDRPCAARTSRSPSQSRAEPGTRDRRGGRSPNGESVPARLGNPRNRHPTGTASVQEPPRGGGELSTSPTAATTPAVVAARSTSALVEVARLGGHFELARTRDRCDRLSERRQHGFAHVGHAHDGCDSERDSDDRQHAPKAVLEPMWPGDGAEEKSEKRRWTVGHYSPIRRSWRPYQATARSNSGRPISGQSVSVNQSLGVCSLEREETAQPLLPSGTNHEIDRGNPADSKCPAGVEGDDLGTVRANGAEHLPDLGQRRVVDADVCHQARRPGVRPLGEGQEPRARRDVARQAIEVAKQVKAYIGQQAHVVTEAEQRIV